MREPIIHILVGIFIYGILSFLFFYIVDGTVSWNYILTFSVLMSLVDYFIIKKIKERFEKKKQK